MKHEEILQQLHTGNEHLDKLTEIYFVHYIQEPKLGKGFFKDVAHDFDYSLREYSITHSYKIEPSSDIERIELLKLNNIPNDIFQEYTKKVDNLLL